MDVRSRQVIGTEPVEVAPSLPHHGLQGADWADAFELTTRRRFESMRALARVTNGAMPKWARPLLQLRNIIIRPFGLKTDGAKDAPRRQRVGGFPIISETENEIILGFDDTHLDFRIVVERLPGEIADVVRVTTLVRRHNLFGRVYIFVITPFHKAIVKSMMMRAA